MIEVIILTADDANAVRGPTIQGHALVPRPVSDGTFALPAAVLGDHAHRRHRERLAELPRRIVGEEEWPIADEQP